MKTHLFGFVLAAASVASAGVEAPEVTSITQAAASSGKLTVSYVLDAPAVVTVDFVDENGASVGLENCRSLTGDANRYLDAAGTYAFTWDARADLTKKGGVLPTSLRARLTAWSPDEPPTYLVGDVFGRDVPRYYADEKALPGGLADDRYKTTKILLKKMPAANVTWTMGSQPGQSVQDSRTYGQKVRLTKNYYIGVFMTTLSQVCAIRKTYSNGDNNYHFKNVADWWRLPADHWSFNAIRGTADTNTSGSWPIADASLPATSLVKLGRQATGIPTLDLPTEAQWEFACRAGVATLYLWGSSYVTNPDVAWTKDNGSTDPEIRAGEASPRTHSVGLRKPNLFGLYDMVGNLREWVQDRCAKDIRVMTQYADPNDATVFVDPLGGTPEQVNTTWNSSTASANNGKRCQRNTEYSSGSQAYYRSDWRTGESGSGSYWVGFRFACPAKCN